MKIDALYSSLTVVAQEWETLSDVANRMRFNDVGSAAVLREGKVAGIITERDLTRALADGTDPEIATVVDYMTPDPQVVTRETNAKEAARMMTDMGIRHLPVVEGDELVGLVSARDILIELIWTTNDDGEAS